MFSHTIKFAVVREDSRVEHAIIAHHGCARPLLVASGGCTMLDLKHLMPHLTITGYDFNPAQLAHIRHKQRAVATRDLRALNVDDPNPHALNQCGAFESLFRIWKCAFNELIASPQKARAFFEQPHDVRLDTLHTWQQSPYWMRSFELLMHHPMLDVMFGPEATQHAAPGSYATYFEQVFSQGLARPDAHENPFLHHIILGHYLPSCAPDYVHAGAMLDLELIEAGIPDIPELESYDFVQLSNIFDWSDDDMIRAWCAHLKRLPRGAVIALRQLNNTRTLTDFLEPHFTFDETFGHDLLTSDRSLFYNRIEVGVRQ
jgi:S-adenosylmethionine-diacylglycerol 3-amino-3-carboxypropyl transferase